jgi:hypothetical protein
LQIIGTADGKEDGPLVSRQPLQGFQYGSRHCLTRGFEGLHGGAAQAFGKLWLCQINQDCTSPSPGSPRLWPGDIAHDGVRADLLQLVGPFFRTNEGFDVPPCLHRLDDYLMSNKARSSENKQSLVQNRPPSLKKIKKKWCQYSTIILYLTTPRD